ncbi:MAG: aspartate kinase [Phycisphaerales bacterium]|nr:aspartate kinase [Phycisphaerales bacterium]
MPTIVQKFGGTSVGDPERIMRVARRVAKAREAGFDLVVVVSAMGHTTDELIALAERVSPIPDRRELDMVMATGEQVAVGLMAMALRELGCAATSLTGGQAGIRTDGVHGRSRITRIESGRLGRLLSRGEVPVVAGFQGISDDGEVTTLGRGGSDTTAVAIAAALRVADTGGCCEIYTDVDGVYTADPRIVRSACRLPRISYEEMLELATLGAGVMHPRAVLFGEKFGVPIHVRHSQKPDPGTMIARESQAMEELAVVGCALKEDLGRVSIRQIRNTIGLQGRIFTALAAANIVVDDIMQTEQGESTMIAFTVEHGDLGDAKEIVAGTLAQLGEGELSVEVGLAKVSAVGVGMKVHAGVASRMFRALAEVSIPIHNITTSEIKISCIIDKADGHKALEAVHRTFGLGLGSHATVAMQTDQARA